MNGSIALRYCPVTTLKIRLGVGHRPADLQIRRDMVEVVEKVRRVRGRKLFLAAAGKCFDLIGIFEELNLKFFNGLMARPEIGWSLRPSYTILGHYDSAHHAIVISRLLDGERVPALAVEYVMFHEMLHLRHPVERRGTRRCVHTAEFKRAEERFPRFEEAKKMLERICSEAWKSGRRKEGAERRRGDDRAI